MGKGKLRRLALRLLHALRPNRAEPDLDREVRSHLVLLEDKFRCAGHSPEKARTLAERALGGVVWTKELHREARSFRWLEDARGDVRYGLALLRKRPGSTAFAIGALALGVGTTAAVYGTVDWLINRPPIGVIEPNRLVTLQTRDRNHPEFDIIGFSFQQYLAAREVQDAFVELGAYIKTNTVLAKDTGATPVILQQVTGSYFPMLGVRAAFGRGLERSDDVPGAEVVIVISQRLWQSQFASDTSVVGSLVRLNGQPARVVGVLPREFEDYSLDWLGPTDVWASMHAGKPLGVLSLENIGASLRFIGRLKPGISVNKARERAQVWLPSMPYLPPSASVFRPTDIVVTPSDHTRISRQRAEAQRFFGMLLAVCGLVLAASCAGVANLLLGQAVRRRRELALRAALGATRVRLVRQLLTEALLLGMTGTALGLVVAVGVARILATLPRTYMRLPITAAALTTEGAIDLRMAGAAATIGLAATVMFGVIPALTASLRNPIRAIIAPTPTWSWGRLRVTPRQVVLMLQVGLAVTMALTAGLFVRNFRNVAAVDVRFDSPEAVLITRVVPRGLSADAGTAFYEALLSRVRSTPGVTSAAVALDPPFLSLGLRISRPGVDPGVAATTTSAGAGLFATLGTPIVAGREFIDTDRVPEDGLVINRELAAMLWPGQNPVGEPVIWGPSRVPSKVVGVVDMPRCQNIGADPGPCGWSPFRFRNSPGYLHVRTVGEPLAFATTLRTIARELQPDVALANDVALDTLLHQLIGRQRAAALASAGLASFGILLVAVGCVSLFVSMVRESLREIAIRMALGASRRVLTERMILQAFPLIAFGLALGTTAAYAAGQRLSGELYGLDAADPLTFVAAPTAIALIALGSVLYAASIAARTEPAQYLRSD